MPLVTAAAAIFTLVGMAAVVSKKSCPRLLSFTAWALGIIMLAVLMVPGVSSYMAAALTVALLVPLLGQRVLAKFRQADPFKRKHRAAFLMTVVDTGFMALALLLMPGHGGDSPQVPMTVSMHNHGSAMGSGVGTMATAVLIGWVVCTLILALPELRRRSYQSLGHAVCSVCMTFAMGVMAL